MLEELDYLKLKIIKVLITFIRFLLKIIFLSLFVLRLVFKYKYLNGTF